MRHTFIIMATMLLIVPFIAASAAGDGHTDHDHGTHDHGEVSASGVYGYTDEADVAEGVVVNLTVSANPTADVAAKLQFFVRDVATGNPITDLQIEHDKYIHVIGVRDDMNEFLHIHPEETAPGVWTVEYTFKKPGKYKLWSDIHRAGVTQSFGHPIVVVAGTGTRAEPTTRLVKNVIVDNYQVSIEAPETISAGEESEIHFVLRDVFGATIELEPFLAAQMHLAVLRNDLSVYIHAHPNDGSHDHGSMTEMEGNGSESMDETMDGMHEGFLPPKIYPSVASAHTDAGADREGTHIPFLVMFPREGTYRLYAQFRPMGADLPKDESLVAVFDVNVVAGNSSVFSSIDPLAKWWSLLIISLILMTLLSVGVYRYLKI